MKKSACLFYALAISTALNAQDVIPGQTIYSSNFTIDGIPRNCTFYIPLNYSRQETYPLIIVLHDKGSAAKNIIKDYGDILHACADSNSTIIIYPDAVAGTWNDGTEKDSVNDAGYLSILADYFIQRYECNSKQIYVAGFGNGAAMAYKFACDLPVKVAAIASFFNQDNKGACNTVSAPVMPAADIAITANGKLTNEAIGNMFKFFMQYKKE